MAIPNPASTDLIPAVSGETQLQIWPEPLDTPGILPRHLKRAANTQFPLLEVLQRLLYRFRPTGDLDKVLAAIALYNAARPVYKHLREFVLWAFTVQLCIPEGDPVAKDVLTWMSEEVVKDPRSRSIMMVTGGLQDAAEEFPLPSRYTMGRTSASAPGAENVSCLPPIGSRIFWIGFRPFLFARSGGQTNRAGGMNFGNILDDKGQLSNALTITTLGWNLKPLQDFALMCRDFRAANLTGTTTVYFAGGGRSDPYGNPWQSVSKAIRKLDTIDMDPGVKEGLIRDAEYYYSEESRKFFADCGIPYRRGYLFYGPPGTGKSSFSAALAGYLGCDIYHIALASGDIDDSKLHRLFLGLPRKCVVVIEDIDSAGIGREEDLSSKQAGVDGLSAATNPMLMATQKRTRVNPITLSGLLNAIDGNASQEGRLLIMTSNNPDALDAALTRPGRIDKKVYFGNMSKSAGRSIFMRLIGRSALAHDAAFTMAQIEQYASEFADKVPSNTFSPAQVQSFLQDCRADPIKVLQEVDAWVAENQQDARPTAPPSTAASTSSISNTMLGEYDDLGSMIVKENST